MQSDTVLMVLLFLFSSALARFSTAGTCMRFVDVCGTGASFMSSPLQDAFQAAAAACGSFCDAQWHPPRGRDAEITNSLGMKEIEPRQGVGDAIIMEGQIIYSENQIIPIIMKVFR